MLKDLRNLSNLLKRKDYLEALKLLKEGDVEKLNQHLQNTINNYETLSGSMDSYGYNMLQNQVKVCKDNLIIYLNKKHVRDSKAVIQQNK